MNYRQPKQPKPDIADLATLIKQQRRNTEIGRSVLSQSFASQYKQQSYKQEYNTRNTQYTSQYQSSQRQNKTLRSYKQEIHFVHYEQEPKEFIAYVLVSKQSTFGIFNDQTLLALDSKQKELKYYSDIPMLPLQSINFTEENPTEIIAIDRVTKFTFVPVKNGVGEVLVSWNQSEGRKQWNLTMGSHRVARQFATIINDVRMNEHLKQKSIEKGKPTVTSQYKVNNKETPFISQLKKIEEQQSRNQNKNSSIHQRSVVKNSLNISPRNSINIISSPKNSPKNNHLYQSKYVSPKNNQSFSSEHVNIHKLNSPGNANNTKLTSPKNQGIKLPSPNNQGNVNNLMMNSPKNQGNVNQIKLMSPKNQGSVNTKLNSPKNQSSVNHTKLSSPRNNRQPIFKTSEPFNYEKNTLDIINTLSSNERPNTAKSPKNNTKIQQNPAKQKEANDGFHKHQIINDSSIHFIDSSINQNSVYNQQQITNPIPKPQPTVFNKVNIKTQKHAAPKADKPATPSVLQSIDKSQNPWLKQQRISFKQKPSPTNSLTNTKPLEASKIGNKEVNKQKQSLATRQIKIQQIVEFANNQYLKQNEENSIKKSKERLSYLESILNNRKSNKKQEPYKSRNSSMSESKVLVKKNQTPKSSKKDVLLTQVEKDDKNVQQKIETPKKNVKKGYPQKYESFRQSLLAQRTNAAHKVVNLNKSSLPKRQSAAKPQHQKYSYSNSQKRQSTSTNKQKIQPFEAQSWLMRWINCSTQSNYGDIYNNFYRQCVDKVKRMTSKYSQWHLTHKIGNQFILQQNSIQYKYYILTNTNPNQIHNCQLAQLQKLYNYNYLFKFTKKTFSNNNINIVVPLTCIVDYKGLKVFCRAVISSEVQFKIVEDVKEYEVIMKELEKECRLSLFKCELYELMVTDRIVLYVQELDALPRIGQRKQLLVDPKYIQQYIVNGIISSQSDLSEINKHLQSSIFKKCLKHLSQTYIISILQLNHILSIYGLNDTFLVILHKYACQQDEKHAKSILFNTIISKMLEKTLRQIVHTKILLKQMNGSLQSCFLSVVNKWLNRDKEIQVQMMDKMRTIFLNEAITEIDYNAIDNGYMISSLMLNLGLNCDFKYKINTSSLQNLQKDIWTSFPFNQQQVNIYFIPKRIIYDYHHFNPSQLLYNSIFNLSFIQNYSNLDKESILAQVNHDKNNPYVLSHLHQLLPVQFKIILNYYLTHIVEPNKVISHHAFQHQFQYLYFNLYKHSTSLIGNYYHFKQDIIGIKWLIKHRQFGEADVKISQMRQRVYIWAKKCPKILMDLNDLQALYSLKVSRFSVAMQKSLLSLQVAIHFFGRDRQQKWQVIWQKSFLAGNIHFKLNKFLQAYDFYQICTDLIQKLSDMQLNDIQVSEQFLQIYNKKAAIQLNLGKTKQTSLLLHQNLDKLSKWKTFFSKQTLKLNLIKKIIHEQYLSYCLLFQALQLDNNKEKYYETLTVFIDRYFQKDINIKSPMMIKIAAQAKQKLIDIMKYIWTYILMDVQRVNIRLSLENKVNINIYVIEMTIKELYRENKEEYIYTIEEMYRYFYELIAERKYSQAEKSKSGREGSDDDGVSGSLVLWRVIDALQELSNPFMSWKRCKLYDEESRSNALFMLEAIVHIVGYDYSLGIIQSATSSYSFET